MQRSDLIRSYFVEQDKRPGDLSDIDFATLTPYHRALLVNDGTVTRLIEASVLEPVVVELLEQRPAEDDGGVLRRRVAIRGTESGVVHAFAESQLAPSPLASALVEARLDSPKGLGEIIGQLGLESRRELLWFGSGHAPEWAAGATLTPFLTRAYRVIIDERPAVVIAESFPL